MIGDGGLLALIKRTIGAFGDFVAVPFVSGVTTIIGFLQTQYYHIHGASFCYPNYANPVLIQAGAGAWNLTGTITEIIPANTIVKAFDLHWINISDISGNGYLKIDFFSGALGAEVLIPGGVKAFRNAVFNQEGPKRIQVPQQPANTRISARLSDSTAGQLTCNIDFEGHVYSTSLT